MDTTLQYTPHLESYQMDRSEEEAFVKDTAGLNADDLKQPTGTDN